jgi:hypothetical protein
MFNYPSSIQKKEFEKSRSPILKALLVRNRTSETASAGTGQKNNDRVFSS